MKKALAFILAVALLCIMAVGTTLTYFTDTKGNVNTMTVGEVKITQNEDFTPNAHLYPYIGEVPTTGDYSLASNAVTKTVTVTNSGSEAAYVRTLFAFEAVNGADPIATGVIHANYNTAVDANNNAIGTWEKAAKDPITITRNGTSTTYYIYSFTYAQAINPKNGTTPAETTPHSLKQIALDSEQDNSFYGYVGNEYTVLVLSQAVQTAGFGTADAAFTAAFPINGGNLVSWFDKVVPNP